MRDRGRVVAMLGPTNTGKTHYAVERMLAHGSGMIGFPLRLLAREVYDRVVAIKGASRVALLTGEEKILPERPAYYIATVEAMPVSEPVEFLAVDEIQLAADRQRGHVFTERLLHARGSAETVFLGAATAQPLLRHFLPDAEFIARPRFSALRHAEPRKLSRLPRRSALIAFSAEEVYALAELVRRTRGGAAVVMGALSPRTRNAQVALYQNGDVDYLVATDAIGMGLNMDIDHVAFAARRKFDGQSMRDLAPDEIGQIAGRAGRYLHDGSFSTLAAADVAPFDPQLVAMVEEHRYRPIRKFLWRNSRLDRSSLARLIASLEIPPGDESLLRMRDATDLAALKALGAEPQIARLASSPAAVERLWEVCQIPDFRRHSAAEHLSLLRRVVLALFGNAGVVPEDWLAREVTRLDKSEGDIDTLASRIAAIRTFTYIANRRDWLADAAHWAEVTRGVEDRLSDALHDRLTQRFVDRRTSVLMRRLRQKGELSVSMDESDAILVEGRPIGTLKGFSFRSDASTGGEEHRQLAAAAEGALRVEIQRRVRIFLNIGWKMMKLDLSSGFGEPRLSWQDVPVALIAKGGTPYDPRLSLPPDTLLSGEQGEAVLAKCREWLAGRMAEKLDPLLKLRAELDRPSGSEAESEAPLAGLARGVAYRLMENFGILDRASVSEDLRQIDQEARRGLRRFHIRIGSTAVYMPQLLKPHAVELRLMLWALANGIGNLPPLPTPGLVWIRTDRTAPRAFYEIAGFRLIGDGQAIRLDMLERLADTVRPLGQGGKAFTVTPEIMGLVGCSGDSFDRAMQAIGYRHEKIKVVRPVASGADMSATGAMPVSASDSPPDGRAAPESAAPAIEGDAPSATEGTEPHRDGETVETVEAVEAIGEGEAVEETRYVWSPRRPKRRPAVGARRGVPKDRGDADRTEDAPRSKGRRPADEGRASGRPGRSKGGKPSHRRDGEGQQNRRSVAAAPRIDADSPFAKLAALRDALERKR
ncbi:MAG: helicase-related protein [Rhodothalassiaceae bacterium]